MTPLFHPFLVNGADGDPALFIDFLFSRRAILFDLGDIGRLSPRKILRVSDLFISHTHIDHFIGFDHFLRICLGRDRRVRLFGPPRIIGQVEGKLAAYTWNLVHDYPVDFTITAIEVGPANTGRSADFHCRTGFRRENEREVLFPEGVLLEEASFLIRHTPLDHRTPSLAFALEEKVHLNVMKNRLQEEGLGVGPWLARLKEAVLRGEPDDFPVDTGTGVRPLAELRERILSIVPGQKIAYVTDTGYTPSNRERIVRLARGADYLFIETPFLEEDASHAVGKWHLTAGQAGRMAREAGAGRVIGTHFSPRYKGREEALRRELQDAFAGKTHP
ncbi:MAG TPA: MBL fold metallo-hydrolase [Verrucomicrobiae bacterium]|nr:MBL fold metallo-hydrolase [Verrucomicrobiae bacterium]